MRSSKLALLCVIGILSLAMADPFENTRWKVRMVAGEDARRAGEKDFDEVLSFKGGLFSAETFVKRGFAPVRFDEDTRRFGPASFTAEPQSEQQGKAKWTGMITATSIKGDLVWTKKDGTELTFSYTGEKATD